MVIGSLVSMLFPPPFYQTGYSWFLLMPDGVVRKDYPLFIVSRSSMEPKGVAFVLRVTILPF
jgi:hypothetical protein